LVGAVAERFCVIDIDLHHAEARAWLNRHRNKIPITRTHRTQRGGLHLIFRSHPQVGCSVGILAPHVDTRGQGKGYVTWCPCPVREALHREVTPPVPGWIAPALRPAAPGPTVAVTSIKRPGDNFVTAKLAGIISRAASAQEGERNSVTFWCGCRL